MQIEEGTASPIATGIGSGVVSAQERFIDTINQQWDSTRKPKDWDMSNRFSIKRGDTSPTLVYTLFPSVSLVGASAVFNMRQVGGSTTIARASASIDDASAGIISFDFTGEQTSVAGTYHAEFEITFSDGSIETYPNNDYITINITPDIA